MPVLSRTTTSLYSVLSPGATFAEGTEGTEPTEKNISVGTSEEKEDRAGAMEGRDDVTAEFEFDRILGAFKVTAVEEMNVEAFAAAAEAPAAGPAPSAVVEDDEEDRDNETDV